MHFRKILPWIARGVLAALCCVLQAQQSAATLHKGANTWPWLYRAKSADDRHEVYATEDTFPYAPRYTAGRLASLKSAGFDFVRIQLEPTPFFTSGPSQRGKLIEQVVAAVRRARAAGLATVLCPFPRDILANYSAESVLSSPDKQKMLGEIELQLAAALAKEDPDFTVFEILNEPPGGYSGGGEDRWSSLQAAYVRAIRHVAPNLTLLVTGDQGGGIDGLLRLDVKAIDDPHILYSFHYYDPMVFTHQGATGTSKRYRPYLTGLTYPPMKQDEKASLARIHDNLFQHAANPADAASLWSEAEVQVRDYYEKPQGRARVDADFSRVTEWARSHHIAANRIVLGEFGVLRFGPSNDSVVNWDRDVRTAAEHAGFAWCVFNYEPDAELPAFSIQQLAGPDPNRLDRRIVTEGLGLTLP